MKLRTRLCIAFCILIFIPLLLTGMAAFGVYRTQSYAFEQAKDVLVDIGFSASVTVSPTRVPSTFFKLAVI